MMKIEAQRTALEGAGLNMEVLGVLDQTTKALQIANQNFDLDKVGDLMDSIAEDLQLSDEFANAISQPIGDIHDEDELLKELEDLEKNVAPPVELPDVPAGPITRSRASRDKFRRMDTEMEELQKWAAAN
ncbi:SNF7 family protein [Cooperia oncophora]